MAKQNNIAGKHITAKIIDAVETWINSARPIGLYHDELNSLVGQPGPRRKLHDEFQLIQSAADTDRLAIIELIDRNKTKLAILGAESDCLAVREFAKGERSRELETQWPILKGRIIASPKAAQTQKHFRLVRKIRCIRQSVARWQTRSAWRHSEIR